MSLGNALSFLTCLPVPYRKDIPLVHSAHFFPLVGAGMGSVALFAFLGMRGVLPEYLPAFLTLLLLEAMTGGVHLRYLAERFDRRDRTESPSPRKSGFLTVGAAVVSAVFLIKVLSISHIAAAWQGYVVLLMPALGRSAPALGLVFRGPGPLLSAQSPALRWGKWVTLLLSVTLLSLVLVFPGFAAWALLGQFLVGLTLTFIWLQRRSVALGRSTLSVVAQLAEVSFLVTCALLL